MTTLLMPTDELVIDGWLSSCPLLSGVGVGTVLPKEIANWEGPTFATIRISPLSPPPHPEYPAHTPRVVVSCWGLPKKWADASDLAQKIRQETRRSTRCRVVAMPVLGYDTATIKSVAYLAEPSRISGDPNQLTRYDIPLQFEWVESNWTYLL